MCCGSDMLKTLHKEIKNDGDWVVYEDIEDLKGAFSNWLNDCVDEGLSSDSKILSLEHDGRFYINFRDIRLTHPEEDTVQDLLIEIEQVERPEK